MQTQFAQPVIEPRVIRLRAAMLGGASALALACVLLPVSHARAADQTISSHINGPISGDGGAITITPSGGVHGNSFTGILSATSANNITTLTNNGMITSSSNLAVYASNGTINVLLNSGTIAGYGSQAAIENKTPILTLSNTGTIYGGQTGINSRAAITKLSNSGVIRGDGSVAINSSVSIGTLINSGTIRGANTGVYLPGASVGTLANSGTIMGGVRGLGAYGSITALTNEASGVISSAQSGMYISGIIDRLTNNGTISGAGGTAAGIANQAIIHTLTNTGTISGANQGIFNYNSIGTLANSGTISGGNYAILGASGSIGTILNSGVINGNIELHNQNVTITGGSGSTFGTLRNGTFTVSNGNLTFAGGNTHLDQNISVKGGSGTVTNNDPLLLTNSHTITGNYAQTSAGVLEIGIYGTAAGQYGSLNITGSSVLDGELALLFMGSFWTTDAAQFAVLQTGSRTGDFSSLSINNVSCTAEGASIWSCGWWKLTELWSAGDTQLTMEVALVPEPAPLAVLAAGVAGLALAKRRRRA